VHIALLLLGLCGALLYGQSLQIPWYFDDYAVIVDYPGVSQLTLSLKQFFTIRGPALLTFVVNYRLGGYDPWGYHLVNIGLHLVTAGLVYLLLLRVVVTQKWLAFLAALVFVAHPLQTQTVNYVVQRMTGLAGLLALGSLWLFTRFLEGYREEGRCWSGRQRVFYLAALAAGALAVLTKENTAILPGLLYLYERLVLRTGIPRRQLLLKVAPFALVPLILGVSTVLLPLLQGAELKAITNLNTVRFTADIKPLNYLVTQFSVLWVYLRLLLLPIRQALDYSYPVVQQLVNGQSLLALAGLLALIGGAWKLRRQRPLLAFAIAWFFLCLAVESSILPLDPIFEHRLYLPMFGFCVALVDVAQRLPGRRNGLLLLTALLCVYAPLTWQRNALWTDKVAFLQDNLQRVPHSERILNNLAMHYIDNGQLAQAEPLLRRTLELNPGRRDEYGNLALLYIDLGKLPAAQEVAREGLRRFPMDERLQAAFGQALVLGGEIEAGLGHMRQAVTINPHFSYGLAELGRTMARLGRFEESVFWLRRALATIDTDASLHHDLATSLNRLGQRDEALREFARAVELDPGNALYLQHYGLSAAEYGDLGTAAAALARLESRDPGLAAPLRAKLASRR
jgi:Flp pilus assembly protein TadD